MKFRKIQIQNFGSHVDTTLDMAKLTFIRGTNASGKTTIEKAFGITLAGRSEGTDAAGKGSVGLIRAGATKALITLAVDNQDLEGKSDGERVLKCALNGTARTLLVTKPDDPQYSGGAQWKDWLDLYRPVLSCLTNNRYFTDLKESEQKDILASIILPKTYEWPTWVIPMCNALTLKVNWARPPFEVIEEGYRAAYAERTNIGRDVKNFRMPEGDTSEAENLQEYTTRLGGRQEELNIARASFNQEQAKQANRAGILTAAKLALSNSQARLSREQQELPGIEARIISKDNLKKTQKEAAHAEKAAKMDADIVEVSLAITSNKTALDALDALSNESKCPTCSTPITDALVKSLAQKVVDERNSLLEKRDGLITSRKALGNPAEAQKALDAHERAQTELKRTQGRIGDELTAIQDAEAKIEELTSAASSASPDYAAQITELEEKVRLGTAAVQTARSHSELLQRFNGAGAERSKLEAKLNDLNKLVDYFGEEVKAELLASSVGPFIASMNQVLEGWGYTCELSIEPYVFAVTYRNSDNKTFSIDLKHLSKSQRYAFSTAFQVALAVTTGFRFVIVDEADIYDAHGKSGLFNAVNSDAIDQAIILATDERTEAPEIEGAVFYRFEDVAQPGMIPTTKVTRLSA